MNKLKIVAIAVITLLVVIEVLQNAQAVETELLFLTRGLLRPRIGEVADRSSRIANGSRARPCPFLQAEPVNWKRH